jgi:hypothetical protein
MTSRPFLLLASLTALLPFLVSCAKSGPPRIPVKGKITYAGGDWPKPAMVDFAAIKPAEGMPNQGASTEIKGDGQFAVELVPGEYAINITCWEVEMQPDNPNSGKSYIPKRYQQTGHADRLTVNVPLGAKDPVTFNVDIAKE